MKKTFFLATVAISLLPTMSFAAPRLTLEQAPRLQSTAFCPDGRTGDGRCVSSRLSSAARTTACAATQSQISASAGPGCVAVEQERDYRYPNAVYSRPYVNSRG